ncbi:uncharacterized protein LOC108252357 [Diaphorina citri]|uniref:Uncharacterized protein LOC108252357 n=1 Tax=Diaphorina citri TaxID=121845 RepID=A0A3Q0ISA6_DIACI|nr:uncharacterized protein LOC108252357 [Diaphorina citri]
MWLRFSASPTVTAVKDTHLDLYLIPFPAVSICPTDKIKLKEAYGYLSKYVNITNQTVKKELDKALAALSLFQHPWYNRMNFYLTNNTVLKDLASINMTDFMIKVQIYHVTEYPEAGMGNLLMSKQGAKLSATVKPFITISTNAIRNLDLEVRFCFFPDEQQLSVSKAYTQRSCLLECRLDYLEQMCACRPYFFNMMANTPKMFFTKRRRSFYHRRLSYWKNEFPHLFNDKIKKTASDEPSFSNVMKEYARYCTLHGIQYVFKENSTLVEKVGWLIIILISFLCASLLAHTMWLRFSASPTVTAVKDTHLDLYLIPFPAVSICPTDKIKLKEAYGYLSKYPSMSISPTKLFICPTDKIKLKEAYGYLSKYVNITNQTVKKELDKVLAALSLFQHPWYNRMNFYLTNNTVLKDLATINMTDFMIKKTFSGFTGDLRFFSPPSSEIRGFDENESSLNCSQCLPTCHESIYDIDTDFTYDTSPLAQESYGVIDVFYRNEGAVKYQRDVTFGWIDLLVSFGGIAGLFLGFSILTLVELAYWSVKLIHYNISDRKNKRVHPTEKNLFHSNTSSSSMFQTQADLDRYPTLPFVY